MNRPPYVYAQQGFSLVETILGAALILGVTVGMYATFMPANTGANVKREAYRLDQLRQRVPALFAAARDFTGIDSDPSLANLEGDSPWGNFGLSPIQAATAPADGWAATYLDVPADACGKLVLHEMGRGWQDVRVDGQSLTRSDLVLPACGVPVGHTIEFRAWGGLRSKDSPFTLPPGAGSPEVIPPAVPIPAPVSVSMPPPVAPPSPGAPTAPPPITVPPAPAPTPVPPPASMPPPPSYPPPCVPDPTQTQSVQCPTGQISSVSPYSAYGVQQQRTSSCPQKYEDPVWSPWTTTSNTCAPKCSLPTPSTQTQSVLCPTDQISSVSPYSSYGITQQRNAFCPAPTGSYAWTSWTTTSNTCATKCSAPAPSVTTEYRWDPTERSAACPAGQVGTHTWTQQQRMTVTTTYTCPAPTGSPTEAVSYGPWQDTATRTNEVNTCAPAGTWTSYYGSYGNEGAACGGSGWRDYHFTCIGDPTECAATAYSGYGWTSECVAAGSGYPSGWVSCSVDGYGADASRMPAHHFDHFAGGDSWPPGDGSACSYLNSNFSATGCGQDGIVVDVWASCDK